MYYFYSVVLVLRWMIGGEQADLWVFVSLTWTQRKPEVTARSHHHGLMWIWSDRLLMPFKQELRQNIQRSKVTSCRNGSPVWALRCNTHFFFLFAFIASYFQRKQWEETELLDLKCQNIILDFVSENTIYLKTTFNHNIYKVLKTSSSDKFLQISVALLSTENI